MEIVNIKNGHIIYNGEVYLVHHDHAGLVAYSKEIKREYGWDGKAKIIMTKGQLMPFTNDYITSVITEMENQYIEKDVSVIYENENNGGHNCIMNKYPIIQLFER